MAGRLQAALPRRALRRPRRRTPASATRVLLREWTCVGRLARPRPRTPRLLGRSGWPSSTCSASRSCVTADAAGDLHAHVQRLPPPRLAARARPSPGDRGRSLCGARSIRCPLPLVDLRARRLAAARAAHRGRRRRPGRRSRCTRSASSAWGGFVFVHPTPDAAAPLADSVGRAPGRWRATRWTRWSPGADSTTTSRPTGRSSPRTTTSATTAARCTPSCRGWCRRSRGGGADLDWDDGIPHREGAWTFTMTGTTTRSPLPGPRRGRAGTPQGRAGLPEPDAVAARPTTSRRSCCGRSAVDRTAIECDAAVRARRGRRRRLRPVRRRRLLGPGQPAGLGDLRVGAARHVVARLHARLVRPDGGREPTSAAGCCPAERSDRGHDPMRRRRTTSSSSGSARSAAPRPGTWPRAALGARARAVRARPRAAAPPTTPRGSCGTATTRPLRAADPRGLRRLGAARGGVGRAAGHRHRRSRPVPARRAPSRPDDYTASHARGRHRLRVARRRTSRRPLARCSRCPTAPSGCSRSAAAIVPAGPRHRRDAAARRREAGRARCSARPRSRAGHATTART